jgi:hypothetical protein
LRENFTDFEKQVYDYIKEQGEVLVHNLPKKMMGAIPGLKNAGFLKTYRKPTNPWASKKQTFVKALEKKEGRGYLPLFMYTYAATATIIMAMTATAA